MSQEEAHNNFSDEFTSEVSIHLLLVFQFWQSTWQFFYGRQLFWVTAKVSTYLGIWQLPRLAVAISKITVP